jgi:hypothetical protein
MRNAMSIDVEDYFQVSAFAPHIRRDEWDSDALPGRAQHRRHPRPARRIEFQSHLLHARLDRRALSAGGARASSTPATNLPATATATSARPTSRRAVPRRRHARQKILEDLGGVAVRGYRAPSFSINHENWWAVEELGNAGYEYSSSIYPVRHDHYGMPDAPRFAAPAQRRVRHPRTAAHHRPAVRPQPARRRRRLVSFAAVRMSRWMLQRVNAQDNARACSISTPGKSTTNSRACKACRPRPASVITSI